MECNITIQQLIKLLSTESSILDIGGGKKQIHANIFREAGMIVDTVDFFKGSTYVGNYNEIEIVKKYDAVWISHCLEHQLNVNFFLKKVSENIREEGFLAVTVPPLKHQIVGGHLSLWNAGLLLYNLVLAGFDCSNAKIKSYDYNISIIIKKQSIKLPKLIFDRGDLILLNQYMPIGLKYDEFGHFDGNIQDLNWDQY